MFKIDIGSEKAIYEQIMDNIKELIFKEILKPDDKLLSVRQMATMLGVNPNTVSKAYQELERQKIIHTLRGKGTFISIQSERVDEDRLKTVMENLKVICIELGHLGLGKDEIKKIIDEIYLEKEDSR